MDPYSFGQTWLGRQRLMLGGFGKLISRFAKVEQGALLVFFAMCCAAIFLIAALSFDLGKRAATQTELQSFADNVALASAAELDGLPGAMVRAQTAADRLIRDNATFALENTDLAGTEDFVMRLYETLPTNEAAFDSELDQSDAVNDRRARFARIEVNPVIVEWSFARILSVFTSDALPTQEVLAEATAGYAGMACDVSPMFICMPDADPGVDLDGVWDPANHIGQSISLSSETGGASSWGPGDFGFIYVEAVVDAASPCFGETGADLYNCMITAEGRLTECIQNGSLALQPGLQPGVAQSFFNSVMDIYVTDGFGLAADSAFPVAPIVTKPFEEGETCGGSLPAQVNDASALLPDDCLASGTCGSVNVGDGDWSEARLAYVDANFSTNLDSLGTIAPEERITVAGNEYHIDDPFRPGDTGNPRRSAYDDYPVMQEGASRWNYYNAEVAAAYFQNPAAALQGGEVDITGVSSSLRPTPIDLLDVALPDGTPVVRSGTSLPHCAPSDNHSLDPRRRVLTVAVVDCATEPLDGRGEARARWFVELFVLGPASGNNSTGEFSFDAEIISGDLSENSVEPAQGVFRNLAQLFR
ncbi:hypothetical protein N9L47_12810 [Rhodobacteraceae bacterium]|nr:hypothetical protein [Paracoccaceae bacterium]